MRCFTASDLGAVPVKGPFSHYLNAHETAILVALVNSVSPRVMIEFGCNQGITAKRLLDNVPSLEKYIGIDVVADHVPTLKCQSSEVPIVAGHHAASDDRFSVYLAPSITIGAEQLEPCDAIFIDGDHSDAAVTHESHLAKKLVRPGGIICWHDYGNSAVEVTQVLNRLCGKGWPINRVEHSWLAFMRRQNDADEAT
jgi:predicted O-methyltransferase YrrM